MATTGKPLTINRINQILDAAFPRMQRVGHKKYTRGYCSNTECFYAPVGPDGKAPAPQRIVYIRAKEIENAEIVAVLAAAGITAEPYMVGGLKVQI